MKWLITFALAVVIAFCNAGPPPDIIQNAKACSEQFHVNMDDIMKQKTTGSTDLTEDMKCYSKCFLEKNGYINADGTVNDQQVVDTFTKENPENKAAVTAALAKCKTLGGGQNTCDAISKVYMCFNQEMPHMG